MEFRLSAIIGTLAVHGLMVAPVVVLAGRDGGGGGPQLDKMVTIEASLAYKKKTESKQPQKERTQKPPPPKVEGVSRDEDKVPDPAKPEDKKPADPTNIDYAKEFEKYKTQRQDDDMDDGEPTPAGGAFDGSEHGFAETSKGDPYFQELAADVYGSWKLPSLERGAGDAQGCIRLAADGRVVDTKLFKKTENANIDRSVSLALSELQKAREQEPKPVPAHLIAATTRWTCFTFPVPKTGE